MQNTRHATQVDHQLTFHLLGLWPRESPPGMSAGSLSMRDMALQTSRYYTTVDGAAALSATKELGLLYYQSGTAARNCQSGTLNPSDNGQPNLLCTGIMVFKHSQVPSLEGWDVSGVGKTAFIALVRKQDRPLGDFVESL